MQPFFGRCLSPSAYLEGEGALREARAPGAQVTGGVPPDVRPAAPDAGAAALGEEGLLRDRAHRLRLCGLCLVVSR